MKGVEIYRFAIIGLGGLFGLGVVASFAMTADTYLMKPVSGVSRALAARAMRRS
jgi:hypothetical protein